MFLQAVLARRERVQRHKEVRKVTAVAQLALDVEQALQGDLLRQPVVEAKMIGANVDAAVRAQIIIGYLRDLYVAYQLLDFGRYAIAARDCFAKRDGLANYLKIRSAGTTKLEIGRRRCAALWTKHG